MIQVLPHSAGQAMGEYFYNKVYLHSITEAFEVVDAKEKINIPIYI